MNTQLKLTNVPAHEAHTITLDLVNGWYANDAENEAANGRFLEALRFIDKSPRVETAMIQARETLRAAIIHNEFVSRSSTDHVYECEQAFLAAHQEALQALKGATRLRTWKVNHVEGGVELTLNGQTFMVDSATIPSIMFDLGRSGQ